jgi:hypothetical protein
MARIEHRRMARGPAPAMARTARVVADPDELLDDDAEPRPKPADGPLDRLTWFGWISAGVAVGWLFLQLRPLVDATAFSDARRLDTVLEIVRAVSGAAALAMPAALELGLAQAARRVRWLYRAAVLLAVAQVATIVLEQVQQRFLSGIDLTDASQPVVLAFAVASLAPAIATIAGMVALSDGLWDIGARPPRLVLRVVGGIAVLAVLLTYLPYLNQLFSPDAIAVSVLNLLRIVISLGLIGITAVAGTHLLSGAIANMTPRLPWVLAGLAGACYVLGSFGRVLTGLPLPQDVQVSMQDLLIAASYAVFALVSAAPILLLLAFATGLARSAFDASPARRLVARWVRYPAA